jgi:O-antigen/teichoic acid export membrane protein
LISIRKTYDQILKTAGSRHASNSLWTVADVAVYPVVMVFSIRFFMERLGDEQYGIWMLVNSLIASLSMVNIGFGDATVKFVAQYRALKRPEAIAGVVSATLSSYVLMAIGLALITGAGAWLVGAMEWHRAFRISDANKQITLLAFQIGAVTFCMRLIEQIVLATLKGFERYDAASRLSIASKLTVLGLNIYMVWAGASIVQIFINSAMVTAVAVVLEFWWMAKLVPGVRFTLARNEYMKEVTPYGLWAWVGSMIGVLGGQMDKLLVTYVAGVAVFAYYASAAFVGERGLGIAAAAAGFLFPIISARYAKGDSLVKLYTKAQMVLGGGGLLGAFVLLQFEGPLFSLIFKEKYASMAPFLHGFLIYLGVMCTTVVPYYFLAGSGLVRLSTGLRVISLVLQLAMVPAFFYYFGAAWLPIGLVSANYLATLIHNSLMAGPIFKRKWLGFALEQGALPGSFLVGMIFLPGYWVWAWIPLGLLIWKRVYFDKVSFLFR